MSPSTPPDGGPTSRTPPDDERAGTSARSLLAEVLVLVGATTLFLALLDQLGDSTLLGRHRHTVAAGLFLYLPVAVLGFRKRDFADYGLHLDGLLGELGFALLWMLIVFPPFVMGYHLYQQLFFGNDFAFALPADLGSFALFQLVAVGLPEEWFYRGYAMQRLDEVWRPRWRVLGTELGPAWLVTAVLFGLGHWLVGFQALRLGVFFPALLFGWMVARRRSVIGAAIFHGASNVLIAVLEMSYFG